MQRKPESSELMNRPDVVEAYAAADFDEPHNHFVLLFNEVFSQKRDEVFTRPEETYHFLDIGCGTCDIPIRMAYFHPDAIFDCLDGSGEMLKYAYKAIHERSLEKQINLKLLTLPLPKKVSFKQYDIIISNSTLHHLEDPFTLWETIKRTSRPGSLFFVMDLLRPESEKEARDLVIQHARKEHAVLKSEFFHSLMAAYTPEEVQEQLQRADIGDFDVRPVSDRHFIAYGLIHARENIKEEKQPPISQG